MNRGIGAAPTSALWVLTLLRSARIRSVPSFILAVDLCGQEGRKMSSSNLIRLGGLAALVGGVLFAVADLLILAEDPNDPIGSITSASYALSVGLALLSAVLLAGGLMGIYAARSEATGVLGLIGFALAFAGTVLATGGAWVDAFIQPALAQEAPELLMAEPPGIVTIGQILTFGLLALGWLILGAAILRARA
jgi:hypothetical protein